MIGADSLLELTMEDDVLFPQATVTAFLFGGSTLSWLQGIRESGFDTNKLVVVAEELEAGSTMSKIAIFGYMARVDECVAEEVKEILQSADWPRTVVCVEVEYES